MPQSWDMGQILFTSPSEEGMLRIFRPGLNPQTWVPEASMLTTRPPKPSIWGHVKIRFKPTINFHWCSNFILLTNYTIFRHFLTYNAHWFVNVSNVSLFIVTYRNQTCRIQLKPDGTRWRTGGVVKGKLANGVGSQYSHATSEHGVSSITTADAHASVASSRMNWRPRRFKWTRPFRRKTKSDFCACAITFQTQSAL